MSVERQPDFLLGAARYARSLPYGRNSDRSDWRLVLSEGPGTCSPNLPARTARRAGAGLLRDGRGQHPAVGTVLKRYSLP
jgi:hypothetical protein